MKKGYKHSEETKKKISDSCKKNIVWWIKQNKPNPILYTHTGKKHSEETKKIIGLKGLGRIPPNKGKKGYLKHTEEWKEKMSKRMKGNTYGFKKGSKINLGRHRTEEEKIKIRKARANQITPIQDTKIEIKIQNFLDQLGIEYFKHNYQHIEHGYQSDIFIPSIKMIIECDGDYWHGNPLRNKELSIKQKNQRIIDNIRTSELIEKGFKVLRLWESDIKIMDINKFKELISIKRYIDIYILEIT